MSDTAPEPVRKLIERFHDHADAYHASGSPSGGGRYNETGRGEYATQRHGWVDQTPLEQIERALDQTRTGPEP